MYDLKFKAIKRLFSNKLIFVLGVGLLLAPKNLRADSSDPSMSVYSSSSSSITYSAPAELSAITYNDEFLSIASEDLVPTGMVLSPDGTKLYMLGSSNDEVYEYSLAVPFDILCAAFTGNKLDVAGQETVPTGITITPDGTKLFMTGNLSDRIHQYDMSTPFDLSTATLSTTSLNIFSQDRAPRDITFSDDGKSLFLVGDYSDTIYEFALSVAFDISTATVTSNTLATASQDVSPRSIDFNANGTILFLTGINGDKIYQYSLGTPFDISTATFSSSFDVSAQEISPQGIVIETQGRRLLLIGNAGDKIYQYDFNTSPFTESTSSVGAVDGSMIIALQGDTFENAGSTLINNVDYTIENLPSGLTPVLNVASGGQSATLTFSGSATNHDDIHDIDNLIFTFNNSAFIGNDALSVSNAINANSTLGIDFTGGTSSASINYATAIELSQAVVNDNSLDVSDEDLVNTSIILNEKGTKLYLLGSSNDEVYEYDLRSPFDISCAIFTGNTLDVSSEETVPTGIAMTPDGAKVFITGNLSDKVHEYTMTTPFDLSTASFSNVTLDIFAQDRAARGINFSPDGHQFFVVGDYTDKIHEYTLSTAFDISTATVSTNTLNTAPQEQSPRNFQFNTNGTALLLTGIDGDKIYKYSLTTAYDISTASFVTSLDISTQDTTPQGIVISPQADRIFISGNGSDKAFQYDLTSTAFSETSNNNGAVEGSIIISILGETFTNQGGTLTNNTDFTIPNLPLGLAPVISVASDGLSAVVTLSGNASSHADIDDVENLRITFENTAFTGGDASTIEGAINVSTNLGIDFNVSGSSGARLASSTAISDLEEVSPNNPSRFSISPNPSNDFISIISEYSLNANSVNLFSLAGQRITLDSRLSVLNSKELKISLKGLKAGIYILEFNGEGQNVETHRVIKN
ncbi:MAG: beta-propeller fold lactonase family protein [Bacteroidota bacterium]